MKWVRWTTKCITTYVSTYILHRTWTQHLASKPTSNHSCTLPHVACNRHDFKVLLLASSWLIFKVISEANSADPLGVVHNVMTDVGMWTEDNLLEKVKFTCIGFIILLYPCSMVLRKNRCCLAELIIRYIFCKPTRNCPVLHIKWKSNLSEYIFYGTMQMGQLEQL